MKVSNSEFEARKMMIVERFSELKNLAREKFGDASVPNHCWLEFTLTGTKAGTAYSSGKIELNREMIANGSFDHILKETLPHELAHIICFTARVKETGHGKTWKRVAMSLGCSGNRCHSEQVAYSRGITYIYTATCGKEVTISQVVHNRIQKGTPYTLKSTGGKINKECAFKYLKRA